MLALYGHLFSSYTWKALIPLYANETPFEFRQIGPGAPVEDNAFIHAAHPAGKFPGCGNPPVHLLTLELGAIQGLPKSVAKLRRLHVVHSNCGPKT